MTARDRVERYWQEVYGQVTMTGVIHLIEEAVAETREADARAICNECAIGNAVVWDPAHWKGPHHKIREWEEGGELQTLWDICAAAALRAQM